MFDKLVFKDPKTDPNEPINGGGYPIILKKGTTETTRQTATMFSDVNSISGIGFLGNWAATVLSIKLRKNMRICLCLENTAPKGISWFYLYETPDNGYTNKLLWQDTTSNNQNVHLFETNLSPSNPNAGLSILITEPEQTEVTNYRKVLRGYILNTDW